jgi:4-carboxymuconolactone decarboxylase
MTVRERGPDGEVGRAGEVRHGRIPWPRPDELDEARREVHASVVGGPRSAEPAFALTDDEGRLHGPFNVMLAAPGPGLALSELGAALRFRTSLSDRVREITILTLAVLHRSSFEWYAHDAVARRIGMTGPEIDALAALEPADTFDDVERTVQRSVRHLVEDGDLDDDAYARLAAALGSEGTVELIVLTGYYATLALAMRVLRSPLPDGVEDPFAADGPETGSAGSRIG